MDKLSKANMLTARNCAASEIFEWNLFVSMNVKIGWFSVVHAILCAKHLCEKGDQCFGTNDVDEKAVVLNFSPSRKKHLFAWSKVQIRSRKSRCVGFFLCLVTQDLHFFFFWFASSRLVRKRGCCTKCFAYLQERMECKRNEISFCTESLEHSSSLGSRNLISKKLGRFQVSGTKDLKMVVLKRTGESAIHPAPPFTPLDPF